MEKVILCILDGFGIRRESNGNAIKAAFKPNFDKLWNMYPHSKLEASGELVGLPKGQMGNSEVGHLNIGGGRIVDQPLQSINKKIKNKMFFKNEEILKIINHVKEKGSKLHIMGLLSDGGVHSHIEHIVALLNMAQMNKVEKVYFHMFLDGRDTLKDDGIKYIKRLEKEINKYKKGSIATVAGRFYGMDRDKRWDRVILAYDAIVYNKARKTDDIKQCIIDSYKTEVDDEFFLPTVVDEKGNIEDNDGIIYANFRPDRATELLTALTNDGFRDFKAKRFNDLKVVTMMPCADSVKAEVAFRENKVVNSLGEYISSLDKTQLRIAETEKYAHVTYFFDGGEDKILKRARRILVPSDREVLTYDMKPEMSARLITDKLIDALDKKYDLIVVNYANCDMVGHTGNFKAAVKAVEVVDECLGRLYEKASQLGYKLIVTADHGNADYMLEKNTIITAHSNSRVPFIICDKKYKLKDGKLGDIAPTILKIMDLEIPSEMKGDVLIGK